MYLNRNLRTSRVRPRMHTHTHTDTHTDTHTHIHTYTHTTYYRRVIKISNLSFNVKAVFM